MKAILAMDVLHSKNNPAFWPLAGYLSYPSSPQIAGVSSKQGKYRLKGITPGNTAKTGRRGFWPERFYPFGAQIAAHSKYTSKRLLAGSDSIHLAPKSPRIRNTRRKGFWPGAILLILSIWRPNRRAFQIRERFYPHFAPKSLVSARKPVAKRHYAREICFLPAYCRVIWSPPR